jgi:polyisoprenoid-binding protein YceI
MKNLILLSCFSVATFVQATQWKIDDAHSTARFKVRHLLVSNVTGEITGMKGTIDIDEKTDTLKVVDVTVDPATINTNNAKRDDHLRTNDFFDVPNHPTIAFKAKKISKSKSGKYTLVGDLTLRGKTKEVTFKDGEMTKVIKDPAGLPRRGFVAHTKINRQDFGVSWNKTLDNGGLAVGDEIAIEVETELVIPKEETKS